MRKDKKAIPLPNVEITSMSAEGKGIAKIDGKVHFVKGGVPGDVADLLLHKTKSKYAEGEIAQLVTPSQSRVTPVCDYFGTCGGCKWQHIDYAAQLEFKQETVTEAIRRIGKLDVALTHPIVGAGSPFFYRNKMDFGFTDRRWLTEAEIASGEAFDRNGIGLHVAESFASIVDLEKCHLQDEFSNKVRTGLRDFAKQNGITFFDLRYQKGFLRTLLIRTASTGQNLVLLSVTEPDMEKINMLMEFLAKEFPAITSLQYVVNQKKNDTIYDLDTVVYKGEGYIIEQLGNYKFEIGPKSFFQTNTKQAEKLYEITKKFAQLKPTDTVYDLYTGVGSIGIYLSDSCNTVTGIEQIPEAIEDAKLNAALNGVTNCNFYAGDVRMILNDEFLAQHGRADVIVTDPPRSGMHTDVVNTLLAHAPNRIVYVSCNAATQARDLELLSAKYKIEEMQAVDMFPQTTHIENVVRLALR